MVDIIRDFQSWLQRGHPFAMATVIGTWRSAPRSEGAAMLISGEGTMVGSVSGGCVEGSVVTRALELLENNGAERMSFGVTDEDAWTVGLSCGGHIEVWVESIQPHPLWEELIGKLVAREGCVLTTRLDDTNPDHALYSPAGTAGSLNEPLLKACQQAYAQRKTQIVEGHFLNVFPAQSKLIVVGAAHIALDLIRLAHQYQFETIVVDPRGIFANEARFDIRPDQLHNAWPADVLPGLSLDSDTYVVVLTHDPKIDDQALQLVLNSPVAYVGALGSKKTHAKRRARLAEAGLEEDQIARIHGPVGIDINAREPAEIALSVMAQIIQVKNQFL